jgi:HEAT repeat protein
MTKDQIQSASKPEERLTSAELFEMALAAPDEDDDGYWRAVWELNRRGTREVLDVAALLTADGHAWRRRLGIHVLAQLGFSKEAFPEDRERILLELYAIESDPGVLKDLGIAFGHAAGPKAVAPLIALSRHTDAEVRYGATHGLWSMNDTAARTRLIELTEDASPDVRDWATFSVAYWEVDTPEIRDALLRRTLDEDDDARGEALKGLARRKDPRVLEPLLKELAEHPGYFAFDAAEALADPRLYPALKRLETSEEDHDRGLAEALEACRPSPEEESKVPRK